MVTSHNITSYVHLILDEESIRIGPYIAIERVSNEDYWISILRQKCAQYNYFVGWFVKSYQQSYAKLNFLLLFQCGGGLGGIYVNGVGGSKRSTDGFLLLLLVASKDFLAWREIAAATLQYIARFQLQSRINLPTIFSSTQITPYKRSP